MLLTLKPSMKQVFVPRKKFHTKNKWTVSLAQATFLILFYKCNSLCCCVLRNSFKKRQRHVIISEPVFHFVDDVGYLFWKSKPSRNVICWKIKLAHAFLHCVSFPWQFPLCFATQKN